MLPIRHGHVAALGGHSPAIRTLLSSACAAHSLHVMTAAVWGKNHTEPSRIWPVYRYTWHVPRFPFPHYETQDATKPPVLLHGRRLPTVWYSIKDPFQPVARGPPATIVVAANAVGTSGESCAHFAQARPELKPLEDRDFLRRLEDVATSLLKGKLRAVPQWWVHCLGKQHVYVVLAPRACDRLM